MSPIVHAVMFMLVASPETYKLTRSIGGGWIASSEGTAKLGGLILHAIVFVILCHFVMKMLKSRRRSTYMHKMEGSPVY